MEAVEDRPEGALCQSIALCQSTALCQSIHILRLLLSICLITFTQFVRAPLQASSGGGQPYTQPVLTYTGTTTKRATMSFSKDSSLLKGSVARIAFRTSWPHDDVLRAVHFQGLFREEIDRGWAGSWQLREEWQERQTRHHRQQLGEASPGEIAIAYFMRRVSVDPAFRRLLCALRPAVNIGNQEILTIQGLLPEQWLRTWQYRA